MYYIKTLYTKIFIYFIFQFNIINTLYLFLIIQIKQIN